tara:strand:- start:827 stop:1282 length:456 start_codon:yes stop_codon:yes gene_type:complete
MLMTISLAFFLVVSSFIFHYRVLLWLGAFAPTLKLKPEAQVLVVVIVLFFAHIIEIGFYAAAYYWSVAELELGIFRGANLTEPMSYLYYSGVIYTSLGLGDIFPEGHIRFITAMEALNGFLLITWTASFTFLAMGRLWTWKVCCDDSDGEA